MTYRQETEMIQIIPATDWYVVYIQEERIIEKNSTQHKWLKALGYRAYPDLIAMCVNRLRMGEKPYRLYGKDSPNRIVSQDLGIKIGKDYKDRKLDFIGNEELVYPLACWVLLEQTLEDGKKHRYIDGLDEAHLAEGDVENEYRVVGECAWLGEYCMDEGSFKEFRYLPERR